MIQAIILDYDGTLVASMSGGRWIRRLKKFFHRYLGWAFGFVELTEWLCGIRWPLHDLALEALAEARRRGIAVGIATDRSMFGLATSARRSGLALHGFDFLSVRPSVLGRIMAPAGFVTVRGGRKSADALAHLDEALARRGITPPRVVFVSDDAQDRAIAEQRGFVFIPLLATLLAHLGATPAPRDAAGI